MDKQNINALQIFRSSCPELFQSTLLRFELVMFPLYTAEAQIEERTLSDYSEIELLMLRLVACGIPPMQIDRIAAMTGLSHTTVERAMRNEINLNLHFDEQGQLTDGGRATLRINEGKSFSECQNEMMFQTVREFQIDGSTGAALRPGIVQPVYLPYYCTVFSAPFDGMPNQLESLDQEKITGDLCRSFAHGLYQDENSYLSDNDVIDSVDSIHTLEQYWCYSYLVQFAGQKDPFLIVRAVTVGRSRLTETAYYPICISRSLVSVNEAAAIHPVLEDEHFEILRNYARTEPPVIQDDPAHDLEGLLRKWNTRVREAVPANRR